LYFIMFCFFPLTDPALGTDGRHDSAKRKPTRIFQEKIIQKKILLG